MKDLFVTLREFLWTVIAVLAAGVLAAAILVPRNFAAQAAAVCDALENEGFDIKLRTPLGEASFARVKTDIAEADARILRLQSQLDAAQMQIADLRSMVESGAAQGVAMTPPPSLSIEGLPEPWAVIAGTAPDIDSRRSIVAALNRAGIVRAAILSVDGFFQAAVLYDDRAAADDALARVADVVGTRPGPYLRALNLTCPGMSETPGDPDLRRCDG